MAMLRSENSNFCIVLATLLAYCFEQDWAFSSSFVQYQCKRSNFRCGEHRCSEYRRTSFSMALEVKIRIVGRKNAETWLDDGYSVYEKRLRPANINVETIYHKGDQDLIKGVNTDSEKNHAVVLLDPLGRTLTSEQFSDSMYSWLDDGGSRLTFVIGGAEGLPSELRGDGYANRQGKGGGRRRQNKNMISLSAMTFTHQFARAVLIEQIYRASEIRKGSGYHK